MQHAQRISSIFRVIFPFGWTRDESWICLCPFRAYMHSMIDNLRSPFFTFLGKFNYAELTCLASEWTQWTEKKNRAQYLCWDSHCDLWRILIKATTHNLIIANSGHFITWFMPLLFFFRLVLQTKSSKILAPFIRFVFAIPAVLLTFFSQSETENFFACSHC